MSIEDILKKRADARASRSARAEAELETQTDLLENPDNGFCIFDNVPEDLPCVVIVRRPNRDEIDRYRAIIWRNKDERGATEAKAKAAPQLARGCVLYPEKGKYDQLVDKVSMVPDAVARECIKLAEGGMRDLSKE